MTAEETPADTDPVDNELKYIDTGFYRVSYKYALRMAKAKPLGRLPRIGYEILVTLDDGTTAYLQRTPYRFRPDSPACGWVWAVYAIRPCTVTLAGGGQITLTR